MRHQKMAAAAKESDLTQEVFLPVPTDAFRPSHSVMTITDEAAKVKFQAMRVAAGIAFDPERSNQFSPEP
jgi:hypothetical protein